MPDFARTKHNTTETQLPDGTTQRVHETLEEIIPFRLTKRITTTSALRPTEEKTETFQPDGTSKTELRSFNYGETISETKTKPDAPQPEKRKPTVSLAALFSYSLFALAAMILGMLVYSLS